MFIKVIKHSLKDTSVNLRSLASMKFKGGFKVSFKGGGFVILRFLKGGRNSRNSLDLR